jgi:hypothetical protein
MPATSSKQKRFMDAAAHNPVFAKKAGVPVSVAKDFSKASKGAKFGSSGTRADSQVVNRPDTNQGKSELFSKGGNTMASKMNPGMMAMMAKKKDGMHKMPDGKMMKNSAMKMASGGMPMKDGKPAFIGDGKGAMKHGGMAKAKKMNMGGMSNSGSASKRADGIATKGKTKGTMLKKGGRAC